MRAYTGWPLLAPSRGALCGVGVHCGVWHARAPRGVRPCRPARIAQCGTEGVRSPRCWLLIAEQTCAPACTPSVTLIIFSLSSSFTSFFLLRVINQFQLRSMSVQAKLHMVITHLFAYWKRSKAYSSGWRKGVGGGCTWIEKLWFTTRGFLSRFNLRVFLELVLMSFCLFDSRFCSACFTVAHRAPRCVDFT